MGNEENKELIPEEEARHRRSVFAASMNSKEGRKQDLYLADSDHLKNYRHKDNNGRMLKVEDAYSHKRPKPNLTSFTDDLKGIAENIKHKAYNTWGDFKDWVGNESVKDIQKYHDAMYEHKQLEKDYNLYNNYSRYLNAKNKVDYLKSISDELTRAYTKKYPITHPEWPSTSSNTWSQSYRAYSEYKDARDKFETDYNYYLNLTPEEHASLQDRVIAAANKLENPRHYLDLAQYYGGDTKLVEFLKWIPGVNTFITNQDKTGFYDMPLWDNGITGKQLAKYTDLLSLITLGAASPWTQGAKRAIINATKRELAGDVLGFTLSEGARVADKWLRENSSEYANEAPTWAPYATSVALNIFGPSIAKKTVSDLANAHLIRKHGGLGDLHVTKGPNGLSGRVRYPDGFQIEPNTDWISPKVKNIMVTHGDGTSEALDIFGNYQRFKPYFSTQTNLLNK